MWRGGIEHWKFKAKIQAVNYTVENAKPRPPVLLGTLHYKAFPQYFMLFLFFLFLFSSASHLILLPVQFSWIPTQRYGSKCHPFLFGWRQTRTEGELGKSVGFMWDAGN